MGIKKESVPASGASEVPKSQADRKPKSAPKPVWHPPIKTHIDIKRTMNSMGSAIDFNGRPTPL